MSRLFQLTTVLAFVFLRPSPAPAQDFVLRQLHPSEDPSWASLVIHARQRSPHPIPAYITGKFAEHLGNNIINGMDAQILLNPAFAEYPVSNGETTPDGVAKFTVDEQVITRRLRDLASSRGWPGSQLEGMLAARKDGLAALWTRLGTSREVIVSPDAGPFGGRAQRVEVAAAGQGICQWAILPLHRVRTYEFEVFLRSPNMKRLVVSIAGPEDKTLSEAPVEVISPEWRSFKGRLELPEGVAPNAGYRLALTAEGPGQFVVRHLLLRPADHVNGADPDIIRLLTASRLPLLRWPGGNFVSGYHWEDGIGPLERRPTRPNYAWGEIEPNLFGTDEFVAFCRAVGCEPMICINAGSGTPAEAARWVEYCNGPGTSPMGKVRAANGHPEPYHIRHWEVGNELWGRWQVNWTTARGYADRYKQFAAAMRAADASIELQACGAPVFWGKQWNDTLIAGGASEFSTITDHPLIGGDVPSSTDPLDVYRDFMAVPEVLQQKWEALQQDMAQAGIAQPRLAVTELQLFAHIASNAGNGPNQRRLTHDNLVRPQTLAEGIYDVLIYHAALRLAPFVEMVTQSAVVNHGGGLRKTRERVFAHPCHYAQANFAEFANATPVGVEIACALEKAPRVLPQLRDATPGVEYSLIDAIAAIDREQLLVSLVNRATSGVHLSVKLDGFTPAKSGKLTTVTGLVPWAQNTPEDSQAVIPVNSTVAVGSGGLEVDLPAYSVSVLKMNASNP